MTPSMTRRELLGTAAGVTMIAAARAGSPAIPVIRSGRAIPEVLDHFIRDYLSAMDAPGMILALADAQGPIATAAFGWSDLAARTPVTLAQRFQIGSITKSFAAIVVLQLQQEGRLRVQDSIFRHLPWLPAEAGFGDITLHHLLTHTSGMPEGHPVFPISSAQRPRQSRPPGTGFHYSNWAYEVLGYLIEALDGVSFAESVRRRILEPLGMRDTVAAISTKERAREVRSYVPMLQDRPFVRGAALVPAPLLDMLEASGCIAATAADMAAYGSMLVRRGAGAQGRVMSAESFDLLASPHVQAAEFGPGAAYGYGLAVDQLDGHRRLRHTGGMVSFMSALQVDLDAGLCVFASVNAQLGYRPNAVAEYALRVLRAAAEHRPAPIPPSHDEKTRVEDAKGYAGDYRAADGHAVSVVAHQGGLSMRQDGRSWMLQNVADDAFAIDDPAWMPFLLKFNRQAASQATGTPPVIELSHGERSFWRDGASRPVAPDTNFSAYTGTWHCDDPWRGTLRVIQRQGRLWMEAEGDTALDPAGPGIFRLADEPLSPETCEFSQAVDGHARLLVYGGMAYRRLGGVDWPG